MHKRLTTTLTIAVLATTSIQTQAANWTDRIAFSGFASANYHQTNDSAPFNGVSGQGHDDDGSFSGTRMGLNVRAKINERFRFAGQLFASQEEDDYTVRVEWAFGTMNLIEGLDLRVGAMVHR
ncbi:MAG: hypothetical protein GXP22_07115 [Gammaproteobacteria bacterium]|nr:hypothetical protein [Gammaproteobacteria bacterium]